MAIRLILNQLHRDNINYYNSNMMIAFLPLMGIIPFQQRLSELLQARNYIDLYTSRSSLIDKSMVTPLRDLQGQIIRINISQDISGNTLPVVAGNQSNTDQVGCKFSLGDFNCSMCIEGYYLIDNQCQNCRYGCVSCASFKNCKVCHDSYVNVEGVCIYLQTLTSDRQNAQCEVPSILLYNEDLGRKEYPRRSEWTNGSLDNEYTCREQDQDTIEDLQPKWVLRKSGEVLSRKFHQLPPHKFTYIYAEIIYGCHNENNHFIVKVDNDQKVVSFKKGCSFGIICQNLINCTPTQADTIALAFNHSVQDMSIVIQEFISDQAKSQTKFLLKNLKIFLQLCPDLQSVCTNSSAPVTCVQNAQLDTQQNCICVPQYFKINSHSCQRLIPYGYNIENYFVKDITEITRVDFFLEAVSEQQIKNILQLQNNRYSFASCNDKRWIFLTANRLKRKFKFEGISTKITLDLLLQVDQIYNFTILINNESISKISPSQNDMSLSRYILDKSSLQPCEVDQKKINFTQITVQLFYTKHYKHSEVIIEQTTNFSWGLGVTSLESIRCSSQCLACSGVNCETCKPGYLLLNNQSCVSQCPKDQISSGQRCYHIQDLFNNGTTHETFAKCQDWIFRDMREKFTDFGEIGGNRIINYRNGFAEHQIILGGFGSWANSEFIIWFSNLSAHQNVQLLFIVYFLDLWDENKPDGMEVRVDNQTNFIKPDIQDKYLGGLSQVPDGSKQVILSLPHNSTNMNVSFICNTSKSNSAQQSCGLSNIYIITTRMCKFPCKNCEGGNQCKQCDDTLNRELVKGVCECKAGFKAMANEFYCSIICTKGQYYDREEYKCKGTYLPQNQDCSPYCKICLNQFKCEQCNKTFTKDLNGTCLCEYGNVVDGLCSMDSQTSPSVHQAKDQQSEDKTSNANESTTQSNDDSNNETNQSSVNQEQFQGSKQTSNSDLPSTQTKIIQCSILILKMNYTEDGCVIFKFSSTCIFTKQDWTNNIAKLVIASDKRLTEMVRLSLNTQMDDLSQAVFQVDGLCDILKPNITLFLKPNQTLYAKDQIIEIKANPQYKLIQPQVSLMEILDTQQAQVAEKFNKIYEKQTSSEGVQSTFYLIQVFCFISFITNISQFTTQFLFIDSQLSPMTYFMIRCLGIQLIKSTIPEQQSQQPVNMDNILFAYTYDITQEVRDTKINSHFYRVQFHPYTLQYCQLILLLWIIYQIACLSRTTISKHQNTSLFDISFTNYLNRIYFYWSPILWCVYRAQWSSLETIGILSLSTAILVLLGITYHFAHEIKKIGKVNQIRNSFLLHQEWQSTPNINQNDFQENMLVKSPYYLFNKPQTTFQSYFILVCQVKKVIYPITLLALYGFPEMQLVIFTILEMMIVIYRIVSRPDLTKLYQSNCYTRGFICRSITRVLYVCFIVSVFIEFRFYSTYRLQSNSNLSGSFKSWINQAFFSVSLCICGLMVQVIFWIIQTSLQIYEGVKQKINQRKLQKEQQKEQQKVQVTQI